MNTRPIHPISWRLNASGDPELPFPPIYAKVAGAVFK